LATQNNGEEQPHYHLDSGIPIFTPALEDPDPQKRADREAEKSYKDEQLALQRKIFWTQVGLVVFGLLGAGVSIWQATTSQYAADTSDKAVLLAQKTQRDQERQSNKVLQTTIDNFHLDQRAERTSRTRPDTQFCKAKSTQSMPMSQGSTHTGLSTILTFSEENTPQDSAKLFWTQTRQKIAAHTILPIDLIAVGHNKCSNRIRAIPFLPLMVNLRNHLLLERSPALTEW
jgi:hypothetical protein